MATDVMAALAALVEQANGKRKKFRLTVDEVMRAVADARDDPHGIAVRHAGAEPLAKTSICVAVKVAKGVVVGVAQCWADRPTPGRAWSELGPWQQDFARNVDKAQQWAAKAAPDRVLVPATAARASSAKRAAAKPDGDGAALLAAILADPRDDQARQVYADWLTERGDPRGEFITLQLELARGPTPARRRALARRETALLKQHRVAWTREAMQDAKECTLARGFVEEVKMTGAAWGAKGAKLLAREPVDALLISSANAAGLLAIARAPHTARLHRLTTSSPFFLQSAKDVAALRELFASPHVGAVHALAIGLDHDPYIARAGMPDLATMFAGVTLAKTEELSIGMMNAPDAFFAALATLRAPALRVLRTSTKKKPVLAALRAAFPRAKLA